tara:strand:+ start:245 stop:532 length:288 start_codon:yes stop_codon:yes gene_type:complete
MASTASHPSPRFYWWVAVVLAVITALEIAVGSMKFFAPVKVVGLYLLGGVKFAAVVGLFMHLKFDKPIYRSLFLVGLAGAVPIFIVLLLTFNRLT